jgi:maltose/maltodextrin transport system substrate-binding protein|tara:strand:+ start:2168 stop:3349 length:1182 start_codon:yes stop_codon:yes gene_type:complete
MMKKTLVTALAIAGATMGSQAMAWEEGSLLVWINADKGYNGLQAVGDKFAEETGVAVKVETPDSVTEKFQQEASIGKGPDIFIWAHDRFGDWAKSGLITPVVPSSAVKKALDDSFWGAVSYNGQIFGYPIAVEGPTQICNADIVSKPFKSIADVKSAAPGLAEQGKQSLMWDYNNTYFTYGFLTAEGGFAFENVAGVYNPKVTGMANDGAKAGAAMIKDLIDSGLMAEGVDYGVFDAAFKAGEVACVINGPWAWADYEKAGIDMILGPYPKIGKGTPKGFTGILSAAVNASTPNKELAVEFLEAYLLTEDGLKMVNDDRALGAVTHKQFMKSLAKESGTLADAYKVWQAGEPMPNIPEMGAFWSNMGPALTAITQGRQTVVEALDDAADRIVK